MLRSLVQLTKHIPYTKFWALNKIRPLFIEPIIDLGCHIGDTFWYMKLSGNITGIDIFEDYFKICEERKIYSKFVTMNLNDLPSDYGKYKTATSFFVLEHMSKQNGFELLRKMDLMAENIVILVPYGESIQEAQDSNQYQKHISAWYPEDFTKLGFNVSICIQLSIKKISKFPYRLILATKEGCK